MDKIQNDEKDSNLELAIKELEELLYQNRASRGKIYKFILDKIEKPLIESALDKADGNQSKAARILGINRNTLHTKIRKLGIEVEKWKEF